MSEFRYELKFVVNENEFSHLYSLIKFHGFKKQHPKRKIFSIYFEDFNFNSLKDNISGISKRRKIRLRWYENDSKPPFLEIKNKLDRVGNKIKYKTPFINKYEVEKMNSKEIYNFLFKNHKQTNFFVKEPNLKPIIFISYQRDYLVNDQDIRLTIDRKILFSSTSFFKTLKSQKKVSYNKIILEIKFPIESKKYVKELLRETFLIPTRHSKYISGLSKLGIAKYI